MIKKITFVSFIAVFTLLSTSSAVKQVSAAETPPTSDTSQTDSLPEPVEFDFDIEAIQQQIEAQQAQATPVEEYAIGKVIKIIDEQNEQNPSTGLTEWYQVAEVKLLTGPKKGEIIEVENASSSFGGDNMKMSPNEKIITVTITRGPEIYHFMADKFRIDALLVMLGVFFVSVAAIGKKRGVFAFFGLLFSVFVLTQYIVPQIIAGKDPILIALTGSLLIGFFSFFLAHGINKRTTIALIATMTTLSIAGVLSMVFVDSAKLFGTGSEEAFFLQYGTGQTFNLRGLLLAGILIGALGVLDDITTAQVAVVEELKKAKKKFTQKEIYAQAMSVGKEHISALVNTLLLAYAGASLPLFLLFVINNTRPFWLIVNSEFIAEEIVRTLVGSIALVLAVPISTYFATWYYTRTTKIETAKVSKTDDTK